MYLNQKERYALKHSLAKKAFTLTGLPIRVYEITENDEIGYTKPNELSVYLAFTHELYNNLDKAETITMITGVFAHEIMHRIATNFIDYMGAINSKKPYEKEVMANIINYMEDAAIEYLAPYYMSEELIRCIDFMRATLQKQTMEIQSLSSAFGQFIIAVQMYGDAGFLKGDFTFEEARKTFIKALPLMDKCVEERSTKERARLSEEVFEISRPLWENEAKSQKELKKMLEHLMQLHGTSREDGHGQPSSLPIMPPSTGDEDSDEKSESAQDGHGRNRDSRRKTTMKAVVSSGENDSNNNSSSDDTAKNDDTSKTGHSGHNEKDDDVCGQNDAGNDKPNSKTKSPNENYGDDSASHKDDSSKAEKNDKGSDKGDESNNTSDDNDGMKSSDKNSADSKESNSTNTSDSSSDAKDNNDHDISKQKQETYEWKRKKNSDSSKKFPLPSVDEKPMESKNEIGISVDEEAHLSEEEALNILESMQTAIEECEAEEHSGSANDETNIDFTVAPGYKNICKKATCKNVWLTVPSEALMPEYEKITAKFAPSIKRLVNQLDRIFKQKREEKVHKTSGRVDMKRLSTGHMTTRVFTKKRDPQKHDLAVVVAIDVSGSMDGTKIVNARNCAICLAEVFGKLKIPIYMFGFSADESGNQNESAYTAFCKNTFDVVHFHYLNWSNRKADRVRLLSITSRCNNFDGYSIRYGTELLKRANAENKMLIVISDGNPQCNAYNNYTTNGILDVKLAIRDASKIATVIGVLLEGNSSAKHREMYGYNFIDCKNSKDLFDKIAKIITKLQKD